MIARAEQLQINLRDPRHRRPTMTIDAAKGALDRNEDEVIAQIGLWLVSWDIAAPTAERKERRILSRSVSLAVKFLDSNEQPPKWDWQEILQLVLPPSEKPWFSGLEIQRALNCVSTHVINLVESRALKLMPGTTYKRGPGGSPAVQRESFTSFLTERLEDAKNINLTTLFGRTK